MNRIELLKNKYPEVAEEALSIKDHSEGNNKYLLWMAQQLKNGHNIPDISSSIKYFHENNQIFKEKDINKYKDLKDLEDLIKSMNLSNRKKKEKIKENAKKIFENDNFLCIRVDDKDSMILYGSNTKWCTTMKDSSYYEEYVSSGLNFYILIVKKIGILSSNKYAIVRKSLFDFEIYDEQDKYSRSFKDGEEENIQEIIQAIIADKPPKNYLNQICTNKIPIDTAIEWLKTQSKVTQNYVKDNCIEINLKLKSIDEIIEEMSYKWRLKDLCHIEYNRLLEIANKISLSKDKRYYALKESIIYILSENDIFIFSKDKDPNIRALVVKKANAEIAKNFINDRSIIVLKEAALKVDVEFLLNYRNETISSRRKEYLNEIIMERIPKTKIEAFILKQSDDILKTLME